MAVYKVNNNASALAFVEFAPVSDGNFTFFHVKTPEQVAAVKQYVSSPAIGQEIVSEAKAGGYTVLATHGDKTKDELVKLLEAGGDKLAIHKRDVPFSEKAWQTGATLAFIGQGMQLTSGFLRPNRKIDWSLVMLAVPNLIATTWILLYGAQRSEDKHRLNYIKKHFNEKLDEFTPDNGNCLPGLNDKRAVLQREPEEAPTLKDKADSFMKRHSVDIGEIGLRYMGALSLAFKFDNWGKAFKAFQTGGLKAAYFAGRTTTPNASPLTGPNLTHYAGLLSLAGKTVALTAKAPDPYNPNPKSALDDVREKYTFRTGGWMETAAFAAIAADGFINKKISFKKGGKGIPDFISGIGGTLFTIRYIIRHWAPFGIKDTNMDEMYAHVSDSLAQMPPKDLPRLLGEAAGEITDHFKDKHLEYGKVYTRLMSNLYMYNHIALDNLGTEPDERSAKMSKSLLHPDPHPDKAPVARHTLQSRPLSDIKSKITPAENHVSSIKMSEKDTPLGIGA